MESLGIIKQEFWQGRRVLVTGHTGFKGAWLTLWLQKLGAKVSGFSLGVPTEPSLFKILSWGEAITSFEGDIRDAALFSNIVEREQPEVVFHLAAQSLVRPSYEDPVGTFATNVLGTVHMLEAVRKANGVRAVINVTSDKCYENHEWPYAYRENDPFGGRDPYSCSKGCAELVTAAYRSSFFSLAGPDQVGLASVRAGNVIGGGDWSAERLIPDCMRAFSRGEEVVIRNPASVRPWQHVLEALRGYMLLAQQLYDTPMQFSEGYNFGPDTQDARPVSFIVEQLCSTWGPSAKWRLVREGEGVHPHEATWLRLDSSLARCKLNWKPLLSLTEGLAWTAQWYRAFHEGASMTEVSLSQIEQIESLEREKR
ncbi:MAG: CDP-glucose 4,6-dehydratase [Proteobacteria bacterium]|nr:CDP-glucose 4,6-dehydratase [Pseudomonadota bacterium]